MEQSYTSVHLLFAGMSFGETLAAVFAIGVFLWIVKPWGSTGTDGHSHGAINRAFAVIFGFLVIAVLITIFYR